MNKTFKVVKNQSGKQTVVSELAKGKRKGMMSLIAMTLATMSPLVFSAPTLVEDGLIAPNSKQAINGGQFAQLEQTLYTSVVQSVNTKKVAEQAVTLATEAKQTAQTANSNVNSAIARVSEVEKQVVKNTADITKLNGSVSGLSDRITTATNTANEAKNGISDLNTQIERVNQNVTALTGRVTQAEQTANQALELAKLNTGSSAEVSQNAINAASEAKRKRWHNQLTQMPLVL